MVGGCCPGEAPPRVAARSMWGLLLQDPPRATLRWPMVGPELFRCNENFDRASSTLPRQIRFQTAGIHHAAFRVIDEAQ